MTVADILAYFTAPHPYQWMFALGAVCGMVCGSPIRIVWRNKTKTLRYLSDDGNIQTP